MNGLEVESKSFGKKQKFSIEASLGREAMAFTSDLARRSRGLPAVTRRCRDSSLQFCRECTM